MELFNQLRSYPVSPAPRVFQPSIRIDTPAALRLGFCTCRHSIISNGTHTCAKLMHAKGGHYATRSSNSSRSIGSSTNKVTLSSQPSAVRIRIRSLPCILWRSDRVAHFNLTAYYPFISHSLIFFSSILRWVKSSDLLDGSPLFSRCFSQINLRNLYLYPVYSSCLYRWHRVCRVPRP